MLLLDTRVGGDEIWVSSDEIWSAETCLRFGSFRLVENIINPIMVGRFIPAGIRCL